MSYSETVMEMFKNPKSAGELKNPDGVGEEGNLKCGDIMRIMIQVKDGIVTKIKFKTFGCVVAIASSEALCQLVEGKTLEEAEKISNKDILKVLGDVPQVKVHCSFLGEKALKAAIKDYKNKKNNQK